MKRKKIIIALGVFFIVEALAILIAFWPSLFPKRNEPFIELRIGIVPEVSRAESEKQWSEFYRRLDRSYGLVLHPYYADSAEDAVAGLIHGALDMLYVDPATFIELQKKNTPHAIFYHALSETEKEDARGMLVTTASVNYINETRAMRLSLGDKCSLATFLLPSTWLREKLPGGLDSWFAKVSSVASPKQAIEDLAEGRTDIIAIRRGDFMKALKEGRLQEDKVKLLWVSMRIPENVICYLERPGDPIDPGTLKKMTWMISFKTRQAGSFNQLSMRFEPASYAYMETLLDFKKALDASSNAVPPGNAGKAGERK
ncbi:MAG: hypothetical protein A2X49_09720 [Lentisphaerae bacterium GWF2_52_8]|nr:MAG: hypothetical protein A2X49_09720 [Lentisphaerae bacterium GWF2_52_8]